MSEKVHESFTLPRTGRMPLKFTGELLAEQDGQRFCGQDQIRWHELAIYRTAAGQLVGRVAYRTRWQGEAGRDEVELCPTPEALETFFRTYDPTEGIQGFGYPAGPAYAEKQTRLLEGLRQRYEALVSDLLSEVGLAEEIA